MMNRVKRPTMADIAARAGVGIATVDRVLTGRRKVREENARRVFEAAAALGYHATPVIRYRLDRDAPRATFGFVLPKKNQEFYRDLSNALRAEIEDIRDLRGTAIIRYAETQDPAEYADLLGEMTGTADVVGASAVNHPLVGRAVDALAGAGIPVFAMLNDFAPDVRRNFIGLDNHRAGRQAAWMLANVIHEPGTIAVLVGGNLWQAHQLRENGLRSYFREHAPEFRLRDAVLNLETRHITYAMVQDFVASQPDLRGIYIAGGGVEGAIDALRESGRARRIRLVVHPLTGETRAAITDGIVTMVIGTPVVALARSVVSEMAASVSGRSSDASEQVLLSPEVLLPECP